ncbi:MAG: hypothetical protein H0U61_08145 [Nocardioidaceae bacterium]|nr:hypothetical protein [Nocardioidaceae bacterium]
MTIDPQPPTETTPGEPSPGGEPAPDPGPIVPSPGPSDPPSIDTPPQPETDPDLGGLASRDVDQSGVDQEVSPDVQFG